LRKEISIKLPKKKYYSCAKHHNAVKDTYTLLAKAYVFGEKIDDNEFIKALLWGISEATNVCGVTPDVQAVVLVYAGTPSGSLGRRLMSDIVARCASSHSGWPEYFDKLPRDALLDVIKTMAALRPAGKRNTKKTSAQDDGVGRDTKSPLAKDHSEGNVDVVMSDVMSEVCLARLKVKSQFS
jgi:hypothetical protein